MTRQKIIQKGAEATIFLDNNQITKERFPKSYRLPIIDEKLRKHRTKSEAKIIEKLKSVINVPKIIKTNDKDEIIMEYLDGKKLSENLESLDYADICEQLANSITKMHDHGIVHGDLTTSNMIFKDNRLYLIDFGLAFHSDKVEDKAVDLHLLHQTLDAKHFKIADKCIDIFFKFYNPKDKKKILERIKAIERRGRYRH